MLKGFWSKSIAFLILSAGAVLPPQAFADSEEYISPELIKVTTPAYHPDSKHYQPDLGTYRYTASWQGIPAATVWIDIDQQGGNYRLGARAKTYSGIDLFYKFRLRADSTISAVDFSPFRTIIEQQENSRRKFTEIKYFGDGRVYSSRRTNDNEPAILDFNPGNLMLEPFSAAFFAMGLDWEKGDSRDFDTFSGKSRYLVNLTIEDKIQMLVNDETRDVFVVVPKVKNLSCPEKTKKLRGAKIYITADEKRELLQIVSEVFIGSVTTRLDAFTPLGPNRGQHEIKIARLRHTFFE